VGLEEDLKGLPDDQGAAVRQRADGQGVTRAEAEALDVEGGAGPARRVEIEGLLGAGRLDRA